MKEKYIDEKLDLPLFKFGINPKNGLVDLATPSNDTLIAGISRVNADKIIEYVENLSSIIYLINQKYPNVVNEILNK